MSFAKRLFSASASTRAGIVRDGLMRRDVTGRSVRIVDSAKAATSVIQSGSHVFLHGAAATPFKLIQGLVENAPTLRGVQLYHIHTYGDAPYAAEEMQASFFTHALFVGANMRKAVNAGRAAYIPCFLGQIPWLFERGVVPLDTALISVSEPDQHGYCSLGTSVDCAEAAVRCAKRVIAQINKQMPRTHGHGLIHINNIDVAIEVDDPLPEDEPAPLNDVTQAIGANVARLIPDGACLQMGIGAIPNAVLGALSGHRDLGIHTEMFSDGMLNLIEKNVITNRLKEYMPHQVVSTFVVGSRKTYDFINDNPAVQMLRVADTNSPMRISRNSNVCAINSCIEIDLSGQVCADSIGDKIFSGVGGQIDFMTGASWSRGGKAILALPSVDSKTGRSRIVPLLSSGAGVVTTRAHVHHVVTEHGSVDLFGKNLWQRAELLISIAHPDKRAELLDALIKRAPQWQRHL